MSKKSRILSRALVGVVAGGALSVPATISISEDGRPSITANDACGQATECLFATQYICSTYHQDYKDYKCTKGCEGG
jgi:hypothetical protein